ncbi:MAG: hypothetical protein R3F54_14405 [Alphaproteobacteria bacterium]
MAGLPKCQLNQLVMTDPTLRSLDQARLFSIILNRSMPNRAGWCAIDQASLAFELGITRRRVYQLLKGMTRWLDIRKGRGRGNKTEYRPRYELLDEDENAHGDAPFDDREKAHQDEPFSEQNVAENAQEKARENAHSSAPQTLNSLNNSNSSPLNPPVGTGGNDQGADSISGEEKDRGGTARARPRETVTLGWQVPAEVMALPPACNLPAEEVEVRRRVFAVKHAGSAMRNPPGAFLKELEDYCRFERGKPQAGNVVPFTTPQPSPKWLIEDKNDHREDFARRAIQLYGDALRDAGHDEELARDNSAKLMVQAIRIAGGGDIDFGIRDDLMMDAEELVMALEPGAMVQPEQRAAG